MNEERYYLEQTYIPKKLFGGKEMRNLFLSGLMENGEEMLLMLFNTIYRSQGKKCPYTAEQFSLRGIRATPPDENGQEFLVILIDMPEPEDMTLASRLYVCLSLELDDPGYFLVEKSFENSSALCGVNKEGMHLNYGEAPEDENEQFSKVCDLYNSYLKSLAEKGNSVDNESK